MNDGGVCRTAPATPGLLIIRQTSVSCTIGRNWDVIYQLGTLRVDPTM